MPRGRRARSEMSAEGLDDIVAEFVREAALGEGLIQGPSVVVHEAAYGIGQSGNQHLPAFLPALDYAFVPHLAVPVLVDAVHPQDVTYHFIDHRLFCFK